jgi:hypothetical protein
MLYLDVPSALSSIITQTGRDGVQQKIGAPVSDYSFLIDL